MKWVTTDNAQLQAHSVMIAPKITGYIAHVHVVEGQTVDKGQLLVEIDPRDYENALSIAKGDMGSAEALLKDAEKNHTRLSQLVKSGAISQQQFDTSQKDFANAKAKLDAVHARVSQSELNLSNTKIFAPSKGFIAKKAVEQGQLASPGVPLIGFVDAEERWITANFKETEIFDVKINALVEIEIDAIPGKTFHGKVQSLSAATGATFTLLPPDNATGNFTKVVQRIPVKIVMDKLTEKDISELRAGLSAVVHVLR
jgi:membrane fusion protein (multidrug efflux system)